MLTKLRKFIEKESLFAQDDQLLLAVSGGKDSMVMLHLFAQLPYTIGIAHYNHNLRGQESDADEAFVRITCANIGLDFYSNVDYSPDTAHQNINNTQERARKERYDFLRQTATKHRYSYILTAHHAADNVETFLLQLVRSAGLDGLTAMYPKRDNLCRPLLFASREEIDQYYQLHTLKHREDQTNATDKYRRNYIRHQILPHFDQLNDSWERTVTQSIHNLQDSHQLLSGYIEKHKATYLIEQEDRHLLNKDTIRNTPGRQTLLYYLLSPFDFNSAQIQDIHEQYDTMDTGGKLHSHSHTILNDRDQMIIYPKQEAIVDHELMITGEGEYPFQDKNMRISLIDTFVIDQDPYIASFNPEMIEFPLLMRPWKSGDTFSPLGMNGRKKKVKEFLIDQKVSRLDKEKVMVLISNEQIIWVVGHRINDRFKVQDASAPCLQITITSFTVSD